MKVHAGLAVLATMLIGAVPTGAAERVSARDMAEYLRKTELKTLTKVKPSKVTCRPKSVVVKKGNKFDCRARFVSGDKNIRVRVKFVKSDGQVSVTLRDLLMRHIENQMEDVFAKAGEESATVDCPEKRAVKKNDVFVCKVQRPDGLHSYEIKQLGGQRFQYKDLGLAPAS